MAQFGVYVFKSEKLTRWRKRPDGSLIGQRGGQQFVIKRSPDWPFQLQLWGTTKLGSSKFYKLGQGETIGALKMHLEGAGVWPTPLSRG